MHGMRSAPRRLLLIGPEVNLQRLEKQLASMSYARYAVTRKLVDGEGVGHTVKSLARKSAFTRDFDEIWLSYSLAEMDKVRRLAGYLLAVPASLRYFPGLNEAQLLNQRTTQVAGMDALDLNYRALNGLRRCIKAVEDRLLGLLLFILFAPLMLVIAGLVHWKIGDPVLFKQKRHGIDGKLFTIYKFRTMSPSHKSEPRQWRQATGGRAERFGALLRHTSLDELPQLYNVLQGRMSLVGPRPHAMDHNAYYKDVIERYMQRLRVKPGMTGWAQVNGLRGITDDDAVMRERVEYDLRYIDNWSLGLDLKILALTLTRGFLN